MKWHIGTQSAVDENGADTWNSINRYYVIDGKVVWWDTFTQEIIDTETE